MAEREYTPEQDVQKEGLIENWPFDGMSVYFLKHRDDRPVALIKMRDEKSRSVPDFARYKGELPNEKLELNAEAKRRFEICRDKFKLPLAIAVFVTFEKDIDVDNGWVLPRSDRPVPILVSICGRPAPEKSAMGVGKSTLCAWLSKITSWPVLDFEPKYEEEKASSYLKRVEGQSFEKYEDFLTAIDQKSDKEKVSLSGVRPFREVMMGVVGEFKETGDRAPVYFCDMPGIPRDEDGRKWNSYDFLSLFGCEDSEFNTRPILVESVHTKYRQFDKKVEMILRRLGFVPNLS